MKILFVGLGSIGNRHAKIIQENYKHVLFAFRSGKKRRVNELGIKEIYSWSEVKKINPDVVFITNPTSMHIETAIKCAKLGCKLFIEKPIDKDLKGLDLLIKLVKKNNLVTYVGYNLRFHPVILELKKYLSKHKPLHLRAISTSFLPNWKPNKNYLEGYSANSKMGGGVILDLSHEMDYISYLLGPVNNISGSFLKRSNLTVDAEDYADLLISTNATPANIHINFLSHLRQRYIQIDFAKLTVVGDLINVDIKEYVNEKLNKSHKLDYHRGQEYEDQLKYFFQNLDNPAMMNNLIEASALYKKIIKFKNKK